MLVITDFMLAACLLSLFGTALMIYMYINAGVKNNFALRLISYMSVSDFIFSFANLMYISPGNAPVVYQCIIQGMLLQFSELSSFIFCFELMLCIYLSVNKNRQNVQQYKNRFILLGFGVPLIICLIPLIGHNYGTLTYSCGISQQNKSDNDKILTNIEASLLLYVPLWIFNLANIFLIFKVWRFVRGLRGSSGFHMDQDQEIRLSQSIILNMIWYPVIMITCWLGFTIYEIGILCGYNMQWIRGPRFVLIDLIGFFNTIAYMSNHYLTKKLEAILQSENSYNQKINKMKESDLFEINMKRSTALSFLTQSFDLS